MFFIMSHLAVLKGSEEPPESQKRQLRGCWGWKNLRVIGSCLWGLAVRPPAAPPSFSLKLVAARPITLIAGKQCGSTWPSSAHRTSKPDRQAQFPWVGMSGHRMEKGEGCPCEVSQGSKGARSPQEKRGLSQLMA